MTFTEHVAPILFNNCARCHRSGEVAPFPLLNFQDAKKHAPFLYFRDVVDASARLDRVVPLARMPADVRAGTLPDFALVVPDLCHSMHDCSVAVGDSWLRSTLPPLLKLPDSVVFVLFDEGSSNVRGGGHTAALALGTAVRPATRFTKVTSHYGLLRTIEAAWGLSLLGRSATAGPITGPSPPDAHKDTARCGAGARHGARWNGRRRTSGRSGPS